MSRAPSGIDSPWRVGLGTDRHGFVVGRPLRLGGVTIPHEKGLAGHSDADALCHAVTDAILGAAALGDIGSHFPDHDPRFKDVDSTRLLQEALRLAGENGWQPVNIDVVITTELPKLAPYREALRSSLATLLALPLTEVNIKAKTAEGFGAVGRGECLDVQAVILMGRSG